MSSPATPATANTAKVTGLSCPSCGGTLSVEGGLHVVRCPFCATHLLALGDAGIRRFSVRPQVAAEAAAGVVKEWLGKGIKKHRALGREAELGEAFLCYLPFFHAQADAVGYAFGVEKRQRTSGSGKNRRTVTDYVPVERRVERHCERVSAAVDTAEWGLTRVDLTGDELLPFELEECERQGMVFAPTVSEVAARAAALDGFRAEADPGAGLHQVHFRFQELLAPTFRILYYPLWVVRYRFRGRSYQSVVDAESGDLAYGKAPGNDAFRAFALVGAEAAAGFVFTSGVQWSLDADNPLGLILGAGAVAVALLAWGFRHFRHGGVVEEGTGIEDATLSFQARLPKWLTSGQKP
ncbi:MAG TPA: hypothetical protein VF017_05465 [Thermoanaerobaculia bacterium]|nr:hypothetical protein [Thermoanaerobaculia bacterium]